LSAPIRAGGVTSNADKLLQPEQWNLFDRGADFVHFAFIGRMTV